MPLEREELRRRAARIGLIVLDVDGVMTDGRTYIDISGGEVKAFDIRDGFGIFMAREAGVKFGIITGVMSPIVQHRAAYLHIDEVHQGFKEKAEVLEGIIQRAGLSPEQTAYMGDDLFDVPPLELAGLAAAPSDAHPLVRERVDWVSGCRGGRGAVRELIEMVLKANGRWGEIERIYMRL